MKNILNDIIQKLFSNIKFTFYAILDKDSAEKLVSGSRPTDIRFYTVTTKYSDCYDYLVRLTCVEKSSHYIHWCELQGKDSSSEMSAIDYVELMGISQNYCIMKVFYSLNDIAVWLRFANHCTPLGCRYETDLEREAFLSLLNKQE